MFDLYAQLPKDPDELKNHVTSLSRMTNQREHQKLFDQLYGCLSILDSKSASLLTFNSIIIAVFAIFMTGTLTRFQWTTITAGMTTVLTSCLLLLWVVWVHWSTTENLGDLERHALILLDVRRNRTVIYRLAWYFSVASVLCLAAFVAIRVAIAG
jgi:hypothetical protein